MRVLHLPQNIASQLSVTVKALREQGAEARGLVTSNAAIQDLGGIEILPKMVSRRWHPVRGSLGLWRNKRAVRDAVRWADIVHWHFSWAFPNANDVKYAARLGKPGIVEFWGSDIRIPRIASADNPYTAQLYRDFPALALGAEERSLQKQRTFARHGMACLISGPGLMAYVDTNSFPAVYRLRQRIAIREYQAAFPDPTRSNPLVVHMPSHKAKKGTGAVLETIDTLKKTHAFDFQLIHGVQRAEALKTVQKADIFLDQFIAGSHGLATLEAMAFGKPALCYIKPSLISKFPPECPIVNANQDNLVEVLRLLLEDGRRRNEIGQASRAYVEAYHDSCQLAQQLIGIYTELIGKRRKDEKP